MSAAASGGRGLTRVGADVAASYQDRDVRNTFRPGSVPPSALSSSSSSLFSSSAAEPVPSVPAFAGARRARLAWSNPRAATRSEGVAEEQKFQEALEQIMQNRDNIRQQTLPLFEDDSEFSPRQAGPIGRSYSTTAAVTPAKEEADTSLDRLEKQARSSLGRLKHILYKLKTRPSDVQTSTTLLETNAVNSAALQPDTLKVEQEFYVSQQIKVDLSGDSPMIVDSPPSTPRPTSPMSPRTAIQTDRAIASLLKTTGPTELELQLDGVTWTRATVKFDDASQTAVMSVTATVRAAELQNPQLCRERTVAMAAQALARTCLVLDRRAKQQAMAATTAAVAAPTAQPTAVPRQKSLEAEDATDVRNGVKATVGARSPTQREQQLLDVLEKGEVLTWKTCVFSHGATPFRPVYLVQLKAGEGRQPVNAVFRPKAQGDSKLRWQSTMPECVAYKLSTLLHLDIAPPSLLRQNVPIGGRVFAAGSMTLDVDGTQALSGLKPADVGASNAAQAAAVVSSIHVVDALLGNAMRRPDQFKAASHWTQKGALRPVMLNHPMGPSLGGALDSKWTHRRVMPGARVKAAPAALIARMRTLTRSRLLEVMGASMTVREVDLLLEKRSQVVAYFDAMEARRSLEQRLL